MSKGDKGTAEKFMKPPVRKRSEKQFKTDQYVGQKPTGGKK